MNETEFIRRWRQETPFYRAWGDFVTGAVIGALAAKIAPTDVNEFIKIPPGPRLKAERSLIDKAFYGRKKYNDPYQQITDKVGVRFVVLLTDHIGEIANVIEECSSWTASCDRDFEAERDENPEFFGYQSVHYVVRARGHIEHLEVVVPQGTPCEIQIRTLLQHAHCELTHGNIYKPKTTASSQAKRYCARSMALIEATDDFFLRVVEETERTAKPLNRAMEQLTNAYRASVGQEPDPARLNTLILDAFAEEFGDNLDQKLDRFLGDKPYIQRLVADRASHQLLFRQPAVLLLYYLAETQPRETKARWPLTHDELRPIYDDLGISFQV